MREIKFRCWHKGHTRPNVMINIPPSMIYEQKPGECLTWLAQGQPIVIMQFTGLLDKNGKEIYEGDILVVDDGCKRVCRTNGIVREVEFFYGMFQFLNITDSTDGIVRTNIIDCEIIGNIYEHPELLVSSKWSA